MGDLVLNYFDINTAYFDDVELAIWTCCFDVFEYERMTNILILYFGFGDQTQEF